MYAAEFAYLRAESLDHALGVLSEADGEIKVLAGGQSLLPMMKLRLAVPDVLLDIGGLEELARVRADGSRVRIGSLTTYRALERHPASARLPAVRDALAVLADPQVRARGTVGGSVAHGDPAADLAAVLLALDATVTISGRSGSRTVGLDGFLLGMFTTDLADDEIVTEIAVETWGPGQAYEKFEQPASHMPLAGVCAAVTVDADSTVTAARLALTGVARRPLRLPAAEAAMTGAPATPESVATAARRVTEGIAPLGDHHASPPYRLHLAEVLARRALTRALARTGDESIMATP